MEKIRVGKMGTMEKIKQGPGRAPGGDSEPDSLWPRFGIAG